MTVGVVGHWDLGWNTPIKELDLWVYPLRDYGVDKWYMCPVSGIKSGKVHERMTLEEVLKENSGMVVVFCDERGTTSLKEFKHPQNVLYVFGKANYSPFLGLKRKQDLSLKIETVREKGGLLWGHQAASIILYDRLRKSWQ